MEKDSNLPNRTVMQKDDIMNFVEVCTVMYIEQTENYASKYGITNIGPADSCNHEIE